MRLDSTHTLAIGVPAMIHQSPETRANVSSISFFFTASHQRNPGNSAQATPLRAVGAASN